MTVVLGWAVGQPVDGWPVPNRRQYPSRGLEPWLLFLSWIGRPLLQQRAWRQRRLKHPHCCAGPDPAPFPRRLQEFICPLNSGL